MMDCGSFLLTNENKPQEYGRREVLRVKERAIFQASILERPAPILLNYGSNLTQRLELRCSWECAVQ